MRALVFSAAILAMSATMAMAFPASFGLPHFVRVDQWPDPSLFRSETEAQARPVPCRIVVLPDGRRCLPQARK